jgi:hypothetical protein
MGDPMGEGVGLSGSRSCDSQQRRGRQSAGGTVLDRTPLLGIEGFEVGGWTWNGQSGCVRSNSLKVVPTAQNCLFKSMRVFGCDLSEKPLKNLAKASDFQAEYEGSIPFTRFRDWETSAAAAD